jgi:hypothetical protein
MLIYPEATLWRLAEQEKIFLSAQPFARNRESVPRRDDIGRLKVAYTLNTAPDLEST